jgi:hypothetical protein
VLKFEEKKSDAKRLTKPHYPQFTAMPTV